MDDRPHVVAMDDDGLRHLYRDLLGDEGYRVTALAALAPDALLLDLRLAETSPGADGAGLLAALRRHPATTALPVVALTADTVAAEAPRVHADRPAAVVLKPFDVDDLLNVLAAVGARRQSA